MKKERKVIYYNDELSDEFSSAKITPIKINAKYRYLRDNVFEKALSFFLYRVIATPLSRLFLKIKFKHKIVGRQKIKKFKGAYFMYGNHTSAAADPFIPSMVAFPKAVHVIVHPANVSMPVLGVINRYIGALPLPGDLKANKNFLEAIDKRVKQERAICIYPEAHIWPYYTKIRPFKDASFRYPAEAGKPVFTYTTTFQKRKFFSRPKVTVYVDGPFYPDPALSVRENRKRLRDLAYEAMVKRSEKSTCEYATYIRVAPETKIRQAPSPQPCPRPSEPVPAPEVAAADAAEPAPEGAA